MKEVSSEPVQNIRCHSMCASLASCASTLHLSQAARAERDGMTPQQAGHLLAAYAKSDDGHGGLCLIGSQVTLTRLNHGSPITVSGSVIHFNADFARTTGASVQGDITAGSGSVSIGYQASNQNASLDVRDLKEIRVLDTNGIYLGLCRNFKPGYLVALTGRHGLPDHAQISINAESPAQLNSILAMLTYFSSSARVVSGMGM